MQEKNYVDVTMDNPQAHHLNLEKVRDMVRSQRLNGSWFAMKDLTNLSKLKIQSGPRGNTREQPMGGLNFSN